MELLYLKFDGKRLLYSFRGELAVSASCSSVTWDQKFCGRIICGCGPVWFGYYKTI